MMRALRVAGWQLEATRADIEKWMGPTAAMCDRWARASFRRNKMLVLGWSGGLNTPSNHVDPHRPGMDHDAAAALLQDGKIIAAVENERLNRIKHSCYFPAEAIRYCLASCGATLGDVDRIVRNGLEGGGRKERVVAALEEEFGQQANRQRLAARISGVDHHVAHAISAYGLSGFDSAVALVFDAAGDENLSGRALLAQHGKLTQLRQFSRAESLGFYYMSFLWKLGFEQFDEYKLMGLAPYGDPARFRALFQSSYSLLSEGQFAIDARRCHEQVALYAREPGGDFEQTHKDIAAALQESLEAIISHVANHLQALTGASNLCLAGGVAHNCSANGRLLYQGRFENVFVQPAAHDAGGAIGAALSAFYDLKGFHSQTLEHVYWGPALGEPATVQGRLNRWKSLVEIEEHREIEKKAAALLSDGAVIGWQQGRSEFGPRALGNRSILADPRPAENKDIINSMIKKREAFRPFAPAVLEEEAGVFFDLPSRVQRLPFMTFVVKVRPQYQDVLGAVTHVDGTARVQTVSKRTNPRFWRLIREFGDLTGVPVVLNTSFNNNAEPIVDSVDDGMTCYLTSKLDYLVADRFLVQRQPGLELSAYLDLIVELPAHVRVCQVRQWEPTGLRTKFHVTNAYYTSAVEEGHPWRRKYQLEVSAWMGALLMRSDAEQPVRHWLDAGAIEVADAEIVTELRSLWTARMIQLRPAASRA
jgi:carbamoyltransferase